MHVILPLAPFNSLPNYAQSSKHPEHIQKQWVTTLFV